MRLRNQDSGQSVVREAPEDDSPRPRRTRVTTWLYVLFLVGLVGLAIWYGVYTYFHYDAPGQIRVQRTVMSPERDGRIQTIYPTEGETVLQGDSLMLMIPGQPCEPTGGELTARNQRESRQQAELLAQRIEDLQQKRARKQRQLDQLRERKALELGDAESRRNDLENEIYEIETKIDRLRIQRRQAQENTSSASGTLEDLECKPFVVSAPHDGRVTRVHEQEFAFVGSGTPVLSLTRLSPSVAVLAYLERDLTGYVQRDDTVRVLLPNGSATRGVVRETYSTAQDFVQVKYDVYKPYPTRLLAEIVPPTQRVKEKWKALDRTRVEVKGEINQ
jgi:multidrug resistance efflux pump